jgi:hypothetical protein
MREEGTSPKQIRTLLLGLLSDALGELRRMSRDFDIERIDREGGRIFLRDGRVFSVELRAEGPQRSRGFPRPR